MFFKHKNNIRKIHKEVFNSLLKLSLAENSNYEELTSFYDKLIDILNKYDKNNGLSELSQFLTHQQKEQLGAKLLELIRIYSQNIRRANENVLAFLQCDQISSDTKEELAYWGKSSIKVSSLALEILEKIAVSVL